MWPKIEFDSDGYMLAASHAIGRNAVIDEAVANFLGDVLLARYPALVAARQDSGGQLDGPGLVEAIARRRGCLLKGGGLDIEKASLILLQDYRDGAIGRVSLESPGNPQAMLEAHAERDGREGGGQGGRRVDDANRTTSHHETRGSERGIDAVASPDPRAYRSENPHTGSACRSSVSRLWKLGSSRRRCSETCSQEHST